ncbi:MAG: hypothetical protein ACYC1U_05970 [Candidatus Aquicultorales bacterium]
MTHEFTIGSDCFTIEEVQRSPHFTTFSVRKNSDLWTYVNIGLFKSVLTTWRCSGTPIKADVFLRKAAPYVIQLGIEKGEIRGDLKQLKSGEPVARYIFLPADRTDPVARERTYYHDAESTPDLTMRRIKWLSEVNSYRREHNGTLSV